MSAAVTAETPARPTRCKAGICVDVVHSLDLAGGRVCIAEGIGWLITEAWFSPDSKSIVAAVENDQGGVVRVFDPATGKLPHHLNQFVAVALTPGEH